MTWTSFGNSERSSVFVFFLFSVAIRQWSERWIFHLKRVICMACQDFWSTCLGSLRMLENWREVSLMLRHTTFMPGANWKISELHWDYGERKIKDRIPVLPSQIRDLPWQHLQGIVLLGHNHLQITAGLSYTVRELVMNSGGLSLKVEGLTDFSDFWCPYLLTKIENLDS